MHKKADSSLRAVRLFLGDPGGIRTPDPRLEGRCSIQLSY